MLLRNNFIMEKLFFELKKVIQDELC